ncbi:hypothetical protein ACFQZI_08125 [Mucilaginibacter lutimaris]|uniref:Lipocalin-like domain-containing protein n=1 Tax=Mucilaginibacter lutimaris TaxID=931629 RepID=A0ABW2ZF94_9SPHI
MKKLVLFSFLATAIITSTISCKKDSNTPAPTDQAGTIVGKWNYQGEIVTVNHPNNPPETTTNKYTNGESVQFLENGTGSDYNTSFKYTVSGKVLTISYDAYVSNGVTHNAKVVTATINQLTTIKLTLHINDTYKDTNGALNGNDIIQYLVK